MKWNEMNLTKAWAAFKWLALVTIHQSHKYNIIMCPSPLCKHTHTQNIVNTPPKKDIHFYSIFRMKIRISFSLLAPTGTPHTFNFGFFCCFHTFQLQFIPFHFISYNPFTVITGRPMRSWTIPFNYVWYNRVRNCWTVAVARGCLCVMCVCVWYGHISHFYPSFFWHINWVERMKFSKELLITIWKSVDDRKYRKNCVCMYAHTPDVKKTHQH